MGSLNIAVKDIDRCLRAIEASGVLADAEAALFELSRSSPLDGSAFLWWSDTPWTLDPEYRFEGGRLQGDGNVEAERLLDDRQIEALPDWEASSDGPGRMRFSLRLLGQPRRRGLLTVTAEFGHETYAQDEFAWRGRIHFLAIALNRRMPVWIRARRPPLGRREGQCLALAAEGLKAKQIADRLGIGQQTVQFHLARAREKLNCSNTIQAAVRACRLGALPSLPPEWSGAGYSAPEIGIVRRPSDCPSPRRAP